MVPRTLLSLPLHTCSGLIGTVQVQRSTARTFTPEDLGVLGRGGGVPDRSGGAGTTFGGSEGQCGRRSGLRRTVEAGTEQSTAQEGSLRAARATFEARYVEQVLRRHGGNISRTARSLGLSRGVLRAKLQRYGLR